MKRIKSTAIKRTWKEEREGKHDMGRERKKEKGNEAWKNIERKGYG